MIDLGRLTALCSDCPQVVPIAGDLTMEGAKRHIYRQAYQARCWTFEFGANL